MRVFTDRHQRHPTPQPAWLGWFRVGMGLFLLALPIGSGRLLSEARTTNPPLLLLGFALLTGGAATLVERRSPAVAKVLGLASTVLAVVVFVVIVAGFVRSW